MVHGVPDAAESPDRRVRIRRVAAAAGRRGAVRLPRHARPGRGPGRLGARGRRGLRRRRSTAAGPPRWPTGWSRPAGPAGRCRTGCRRTWPRRWADRDLYAARPPRRLHRAGRDRAHRRRRASPTRCTSGCCGPDGWLPYADTVPTLRALHDAGVPVAVVSNIGFDIRPHLRRLGLRRPGRRVRAVVRGGPLQAGPGDLPARPAGMLGVDPERTLMVGDTPADAGAVRRRLRRAGAAGRRPGRGQRPGRRARAGRLPADALDCTVGQSGDVSRSRRVSAPGVAAARR